MTSSRVYFDYAATTPLREPVRVAMQNALNVFGNPSSIHAEGQAARALTDDARRHVAELVNAHPGWVVFTSGGTEANNLALRGIMTHPSAAGKRLLVSTQEHDCVLNTAKALAESGVAVGYIPVTEQGCVDLQELEAELQKGDVVLVSIMHANNEHGAVQPLAAVARLCKQYGVFSHTDAVQTVGHIPVDMNALGVDALTLTAHKLGGPKGAGALIVKPELGDKMLSHVSGGGQERNRRAGTENVMGIVGLGEAARLAKENLETEFAAAQAIRKKVLTEIDSLGALVQVVAPSAPKVPHVIQLLMARKKGEDAVMALDVQGVSASQGSACSSGRVQASHVLQALGYTEKEAGRGLRLSWGHLTTADEVAVLGAALRKVLA